MSEHIVSRSVYYTIFGVLLLCTGLTIAIAYVDLGDFNIVVALLIAGFKASLVILFFMHVKFGTRLTKMFVAIGVIWLGIMIAITMTDYISRSWLTYKP